MAEAFGVWAGRDLVGYGGVWKRHFPGRLMEFYLELGHPEADALAGIAAASRMTHLEAQTNIPTMLALLLRWGSDLRCENALFEEDPTRVGDSLPLDDRRLPFEIRERKEGEQGPEGDVVLCAHEAVLAAGGLMTHYNDPYVDLYMEVAPQARRRGYGASLVKALRQRAQEAHGKPSARCSPHNMASRRTLRRGGMRQCGWLLSGRFGRTTHGSGATK